MTNTRKLFNNSINKNVKRFTRKIDGGSSLKPPETGKPISMDLIEKIIERLNLVTEEIQQNTNYKTNIAKYLANDNTVEIIKLVNEISIEAAVQTPDYVFTKLDDFVTQNDHLFDMVEHIKHELTNSGYKIDHEQFGVEDKTKQTIIEYITMFDKEKEKIISKLSDLNGKKVQLDNLIQKISDKNKKNSGFLYNNTHTAEKKKRLQTETEKFTTANTKFNKTNATFVWLLAVNNAIIYFNNLRGKANDNTTTTLKNDIKQKFDIIKTFVIK
jgi:hypothetical protein